MSLSDPIADMFTRIRNASRAKHESCRINGSKVKKAILAILKEEGYIADYQESADKNAVSYEVKLKYDSQKRSVIQEIDRISKPGRRIYIQAEDVRPYKSNMGISIISTSQGIMTNKKAIKLKIGGEVICQVS